MEREQATTQALVRAHPGLLSDRALAKLLIFTAAGLSFLASVHFYFTGDPERGIYVGLWVPSICSAGALLLSRGRHD